jgi:hypothetical protein
MAIQSHGLWMQALEPVQVRYAVVLDGREVASATSYEAAKAAHRLLWGRIAPEGTL